MNTPYKFSLLSILILSTLTLLNSCGQSSSDSTKKDGPNEQNTAFNHSSFNENDKKDLPPPPIGDTKIANTSLSPKGVWEGVDITGKKFEITINEDGTATSTLSELEHGKWKVVNQKKTHVEWNNGANEYLLIEKIGSAQRHAYEPGTPINDTPDEITHLKRKA